MHKNTSLYFGSFGSENEGQSPVLAVSEIRWPFLSHLARVGLSFLWYAVGIIVFPSSLHRVAVKIKVGVNEHLKSNQKPSILPRSNVLAHEVNTRYCCCLLFIKMLCKCKDGYPEIQNTGNIFIANTNINSQLSCTMKSSFKFLTKISRSYYMNKQNV